MMQKLKWLIWLLVPVLPLVLVVIRRELEPLQTTTLRLHVTKITDDDDPLIVDLDGCPCQDKSLCRPLAHRIREKEIFGFSGGNGTGIDFGRVTTIAWAENKPELLCIAHKHGVKLIAKADLYKNYPYTLDTEVLTDWAVETEKVVRSQYLDGIVFDWEEPAEVGSRRSAWYTLIVNVTRDVFHRINPNYQVSTCVAWSPDNIDERGYDYKGLADASDLLYVMDYDTRSQIFDQCIAAANAPFFGMVKGIRRYGELGIPMDKLILGVPWYGYRYPCLQGTSATARFCPIEPIPFRGVNCSDAAGSEMRYDEILSRFEQYHTTPIHWDSHQKAAFFNTWENETVVQYWFDNAESLHLKYTFAKQYGLRGVGPFQFIDTADPVIWQLFDTFLT